MGTVEVSFWCALSSLQARWRGSAMLRGFVYQQAAALVHRQQAAVLRNQNLYFKKKACLGSPIQKWG